ncbi:MAG: hypothetical protein LBG80_16655 [Bacteroidales bacterium]|nr:hypothetical protein [Bacteroidales bacterium]
MQLVEEFTLHCDCAKTTIADDAFSFTELHYKQNDKKLLKMPNREKNMRIS